MLPLVRRIVLLACAAPWLSSCSVLLPSREACPTALLQGRLVTDGQGRALVESEFGSQPVRWPDGYTVAIEPVFELKDRRGSTVATAGDIIYVGGGMDAADEVFIACGYVSRDPPGGG
jgi:hypothetical protein